MKQTTKRALAILLIIAIAIGIGFATDAVWTWIERQNHPRDYANIVQKYASEYNIPEEIIFSVIKAESGFDPSAKSKKDALGLMQMIPDTFEWLTGEEHLGENLPFSSLENPDVSIRYGTYYLSYLAERFDRNWTNVFAAYNAGETRVAKWLKNPEYMDESGTLIDFNGFEETETYVKRVNRSIEKYRELYPES